MTNLVNTDRSDASAVPHDRPQPRNPKTSAPILVVVPVLAGRHAVVALTGDLDLSTADQVRAAAERCLTRRPERLSMDLSGLAFCDCSGIRVLRRTLDDADTSGVEFRLLAPSDWIRRVFTLADAADLLAASTDLPEPQVC